MKVCLFFTNNVSLLDWKVAGYLSRELTYYQRLNDMGGINKLCFLTYGTVSDKSIKLPSFITVAPIGGGINRRGMKGMFISLWRIWKIRKELVAYDVFKTNQMRGAWVAIIAGILMGRPVLLRCGYEYFRFLTLQDEPLHRRVVPYIASLFAYTFANKIHIPTSDDAQYIRKTFFVRARKIKIVPNWIDCSVFVPGHSKSSNGVISVGRLSRQKRFDLVIEALPRNVTLDIYGAGPLLSSLVALTEERKANVRFKGQVDNNILASTFHNYRFFVLCSDFEGNPKVLLEAMAAGLVVFVRRSPGIENLVVDGINGFLFDTVEQLEALITKFCSTSSSKHDLENVSMRARAQILRSNDVSLILAKEIGSLKSIAK